MSEAASLLGTLDAVVALSNFRQLPELWEHRSDPATEVNRQV